MRTGGINAIKSTSQRAVVQHWREIKADRRLPSIGDFAPPRPTHDPRQLMLWAIEGTGPTRCFKTLTHGKFLTEAFGINPLPLQPLQAVVPPPLQELVETSLHACADAGAPIYTVISTWDSDGCRINCERLLLPFGEEQGEPRQIATVLQLFSPNGQFTRQTALSLFLAQAKVTFSVQISFDRANAPAAGT
jgi:hypothetical protein